MQYLIDLPWGSSLRTSSNHSSTLQELECKKKSSPRIIGVLVSRTLYRSSSDTQKELSALQELRDVWVLWLVTLVLSESRMIFEGSLRTRREYRGYILPLSSTSRHKHDSWTSPVANHGVKRIISVLPNKLSYWIPRSKLTRLRCQ